MEIEIFIQTISMIYMKMLVLLNLLSTVLAVVLIT